MWHNRWPVTNIIIWRSALTTVYTYYASNTLITYKYKSESKSHDNKYSSILSSYLIVISE